MIRKCKRCGKEFNSKYGSQYCSEECRNVGTGRKLYKAGTECACGCCGNVFIKQYGNEQYCSEQCKSKAKTKAKQKSYYKTKKKTVKTCVYCGKTYTERGFLYCSAECTRKARWQREKAELRREKENIFGSYENYKIMSERLEEMEKLARIGQNYAEKARRYYLKQCVVCGKEFKTLNKNQRACCQKCSKKLEYARMVRRIPRDRVIDKDITLEAVYRKDSGVCYLCGKKCDWNDKTWGNGRYGALYPSIDHVIPLSKGGEHSWKNVRLAHFICNSNKSDTLPKDKNESD